MEWVQMRVQVRVQIVQATSVVCTTARCVGARRGTATHLSDKHGVSNPRRPIPRRNCSGPQRNDRAESSHSGTPVARTIHQCTRDSSGTCHCSSSRALSSHEGKPSATVAVTRTRSPTRISRRHGSACAEGDAAQVGEDASEHPVSARNRSPCSPRRTHTSAPRRHAPRGRAHQGCGRRRGPSGRWGRRAGCSRRHRSQADTCTRRDRLTACTRRAPSNRWDSSALSSLCRRSHRDTGRRR